MEIIEGTALSNLCDYSFGDQIGAREPQSFVGGFMKPANESNYEFLHLARQFEGKVMTLFIDNIRLYPRNISCSMVDAPWISYLMKWNDLLGLCRQLTNNKFIIFTSHEDTPIDDQIEVPDNVLSIHAVNAEYFNDKIRPFPYGVQRPINRLNGPIDNRIEVLHEEIGKAQEPTKLLYINCGIERHPDRAPLAKFDGLSWVTTRFDRNSMFFPYDRYRDFLTEMRDHKFMICPVGHGLDCHRNWELHYMRRIPVMKKHPYLLELMKGLPVLWVDEWSDVSKELLEASDHLYQQAQTIDLLDLKVMFNNIYETNK